MQEKLEIELRKLITDNAAAIIETVRTVGDRLLALEGRVTQIAERGVSASTNASDRRNEDVAHQDAINLQTSHDINGDGVAGLKADVINNKSDLRDMTTQFEGLKTSVKDEFNVTRQSIADLKESIVWPVRVAAGGIILGAIGLLVELVRGGFAK